MHVFTAILLYTLKDFSIKKKKRKGTNGYSSVYKIYLQSLEYASQN